MKDENKTEELNDEPVVEVCDECGETIDECCCDDIEDNLDI